MRKAITIIALCVALGASAQEQTREKPLRIGAEAGLTLSNYTNSDHYVREGFYIGARGQYQLNDCYLSASLRLTRKGADCHTGDDDGSDYYEAYYVELPMAIGISGKIGRKATLFGEMGPYVAVGVGGKNKGEIFGGKNTISYDNKFFSKKNDSPRRFGAGWGIHAGVRLNRVEIIAGYEIGFCSVWSKSDNQFSNRDYHNSSFSLGVAYMF